MISVDVETYAFPDRPTHLDRYSLPRFSMMGNVNLSKTGDTDRLWVKVVKDFGQWLSHI
jgi:hypothetical protein